MLNMHLFSNLFLTLEIFFTLTSCVEDNEFIKYINIFQTCGVEIIENILLPRNKHHNIDMDMKVDFPARRTSHSYKETSRQARGLIRRKFYMLCDNKPAILIPSSTYRYNTTVLPIKTHLVSCEAVIYIMPFKSCKRWSVNPKQIERKSTSLVDSNESTDFFVDESPIYRDGKYYVLVGDTDTMTQTIKGHVFHEIDVPPLAPLGTLSLIFHIKFYLEIRKSGATFYLAKYGNVADIIERVSKKCSDSEKNKGLLKLFSVHCVLSNYLKSKYVFYKLDFKNAYSEKTLMNTVSPNDLNYQQLYWVLRCPNCNFELTGTHKSTDNHRLTNWKGQPPLELILIYLLFENSTVLTDLRFSDNSLPLQQIYIDQNINRMQFVRIEKKGFHFVTCANILKISRLDFKGLISSFDLYTWVALLATATFSTFVLIYLQKHSNIKYDTYDMFSFTIIIILEQDIKRFTGNACFVTGAWFLAGLIISQFYRGDNISHLTAPFGKPKLQYYTELLDRNFSFLSPISFQSRLKEEEDNLNLLEGLTPILNSVMNSTTVEDILSNHFVSEFETTYVNSVTSERLALINKINANLSRSHQMKNFSQAVLESNYFIAELKPCGRKAYIGSYENAFLIYSKLKDRLQKTKSVFMDSSLSLSKETLAPSVTAWKFERVPVIDSNQFIIRVHSILQSGIMDLWNKWNLRIKTYNDTVLVAKSSNSHVKSLSVHGNVMVVFFLWIGILSLDCVVFGTEVLVWVLMKSTLKGNSNTSNTQVVSIKVLSLM